MKTLQFILLFGIISTNIVAQSDSTAMYKKRVLESTEVDILSSYFKQEGDNASVTGGIGNEDLTDFTPNIIISMPLNDDAILTVDFGFSTYTSASSSNADPFDSSGASSGEEEDDDDEHEEDDDDDDDDPNTMITGSPWLASSGASEKDTWVNLTVAYSHYSDDRNKIWSANSSYAKEYDYTSFGLGGGYSRLFNEKNTEIGINANLYLDTWKPVYPTELDTYLEVNGDLTTGFFSTADILDQNGSVTEKNGNTWNPENFKLINDKGRNTYSLSLAFSQILSRNAQISIFADLVQQNGWLSNPMQRVYFADKSNYFIGNSESISYYTSKQNTDVFMLADDIEQLPDTRLKIPIGMRLNYFINEFITLRTYYRYYTDDWGIHSNTFQIELPIKFLRNFTLYPSFRYYDQTAADYFAPFDSHLSTSTYYTSDYDLSKFNATQYGIGLSYTDIFTHLKIGKFGLKSVDLKYNNYERNTGLKANYFAFSIKLIKD
jgi:hypothetical protein